METEILRPRHQGHASAYGREVLFHRRDSMLVDGVPYAAFHGNKRYALGLPSRGALNPRDSCPMAVQFSTDCLWGLNPECEEKMTLAGGFAELLLRYCFQPASLLNREGLLRVG